MLTIAVDRERLNRLLPYLVSLAAGALLGVAGSHLLPEAIQQLGTDWHLSALLLAGFVAFFLVEKSLALFSQHWPHLLAGHDHCHDSHPAHFDQNHRALRANLLVGGAIHSLIDGMAVAIAYSASVPAGIATTVAVALHEVPHHIGDVGVLLYSGMPARRAVLAKFAATSVSLLGVLVVLLPGPQGRSLAAHLLPVTAASFLYIALANLLPTLQREEDLKVSVKQAAILMAGILMMFALNWVQEA
jgi:zinc and cadmium transporter